MTYFAIAVLTAFYVGLDTPSAQRPKGLGEWLGFVILFALWPFTFVYAMYWAIRNRN